MEVLCQEDPNIVILMKPKEMISVEGEWPVFGNVELDGNGEDFWVTGLI